MLLRAEPKKSPARASAEGKARSLKDVLDVTGESSCTKIAFST